MTRIAFISTIRHFTCGAVPLLGLLGVAACDSPSEMPSPTGPVPVASIEVQGVANGVVVGQTVQLNAVVRAADGSTLDRPVVWSSIDTALATVSDAGALTARAVGTARIKAASGGREATALIPIRHATPAVVQLMPASAVAGADGFELTVAGTGFAPGATVRWNGVDRPTRVISSTEVRADVVAVDLQGVGLAEVMVVNPGSGEGLASQRLHFSIEPLVVAPVATALTPAAAQAGGPTFELVVAGSGFVTGATLRWNGLPRTTRVISASEVRADILAADIATTGNALVVVTNPASVGGLSSGGLSFTIQPAPAAVPTLTELRPGSAVAGSAGFQMHVGGSGFVAGATVRWNGQARVTHVISATEAVATLTAADLHTYGSATVTLVNPASVGGRSSGGLQFTIRPRPPVITAVEPGALRAGNRGARLEILGSGFVSGATVRWNGQPRNTRFLTSTVLEVDITAADLATAGAGNLTVVNPASAGGASSLNWQFTIMPAAAAPLVTYRLTGLHSGDALPIEVSRNDWVDDAGVAHASIQRVVEGTLKLRYEATGDSWEESVTIVRYLASTGAEVRRDTFVNHGPVHYDPESGMPRLMSAMWYGAFIATTLLNEQQIVLYQTHDTTGRVQQKKAWLYVRQ